VGIQDEMEDLDILIDGVQKKPVQVHRR